MGLFTSQSESSPTVATDSGTKFRLLVADDDPHDRLLFGMAADESGHDLDVHFVDDGLEALEYLRTEGAVDVVILDLRMPRCDGHEVLAAMAADPELQDIAAIVFSNSRRDQDIETSVESGALWHAVKPSTYEDLVEFVNSVVSHCSS
ncbi:MAG: response regulator [Acidimicrobiales bacterium]|nr:response regulator [Acidimicrobiales bacterium]